MSLIQMIDGFYRLTILNEVNSSNLYWWSTEL